jgi:hypothetical protein
MYTCACNIRIQSMSCHFEMALVLISNGKQLKIGYVYVINCVMLNETYVPDINLTCA